jgi:hypothetical protein
MANDGSVDIMISLVQDRSSFSKALRLGSTHSTKVKTRYNDTRHIDILDLTISSFGPRRFLAAILTLDTTIPRYIA